MAVPSCAYTARAGSARSLPSWETAIASSIRISRSRWKNWEFGKCSERSVDRLYRRVIGTMRRQCLNHMIVFNEESYTGM